MESLLRIFLSRHHRARRLKECICPGHGVRVRWHFHHEVLMASVSMTIAQKFTISVLPEDAGGNPGQIDGPPTWAVDTPGIVTLTPAADGLTCVVAGLAVGSCNVTPSATSGGGANTITGAPVSVTCTPALNPATQLIEAIGSVVPQ